MGWTEYEYYNTSFRGYALACRGYWEKDQRQQHYLRRAAYIVHASLVEKPLAPLKLWPIGEEVEQAARDEESFKERMLRKTAEALKRNRELAEKEKVE